MAVGIAPLDHEVTALNKADIGKPLPHTTQCLSVGAFRSDPEIAKAYPHTRLGKRATPNGAASGQAAAEKRDELAPLHSITSSARASSIGGTSMPSALAVLRLITRSYLVGAWTGRSAGFSPLRMRSTYPAARRNSSTILEPYELSPPAAAK